MMLSAAACKIIQGKSQIRVRHMWSIRNIVAVAVDHEDAKDIFWL